MKRKLFLASLLFVSLILMALPNAVAMTFAAEPPVQITNYYSFFSDMPIGYGNWFPIITAVLAITVLVLIFISLKMNLRKSILICLGIATIAHLASWLIFNTFTIISLIIFILHILILIITLTHKYPTKWLMK